MRFSIVGSIVGWLILCISSSAQESKQSAKNDGKVITQLPVEHAEVLLKKQGLEFKKIDSKTAGVVFYDFKRRSFNVRFYYYEGKDLMLDAVFPAVPLERINDWNRKAKFSRATVWNTSGGSDGISSSVAARL